MRLSRFSLCRSFFTPTHCTLACTKASLPLSSSYQHPKRITIRLASTMANLGKKIPDLKLKDGTLIPLIGFGTGTAWYKKEDNDEVDRKTVDAIKTAIKVGYNHIDAAEIYNTEPEVGVAIKESKVEREKLFVTTKVLPNIADIPKALDTSLKKLGLDYVDLYLIHAPFFAKSDAELQSAWQSMEAVQRSGKAKSIGVSNYTESHLRTTLAAAQIPPSINQIEFHQYLQQPGLHAFMQEHGIATAAYAPLSAVTKAKPGPCDEQLAFLAKKYYVGEGEIALRWCLEQDVVAVTTSGKEERLSDYLRALSFSMTPKEVQDLSAAGLEKHFRGFWAAKLDGEK